MNIDTITSQLEALRMRTAARELPEALARQRGAVSLDWLSDLFQNEIDARKERAIDNRIRRAGFPEITSIETFDFAFNPDISREKIEALATLEFMKTNQIALFLGPPGTGKTHIAAALGVKAARQGYRVHCTSAKRLAQSITMAKLRNNLDVLFRRILAADLWIIDDWGVISMNREIAEEVFDLLDRRKNNAAMILTSNRDVQEWGEVFPDLVIANATIDRIFDRAQIVIFKGESYRLKGRLKMNDIDITKMNT